MGISGTIAGDAEAIAGDPRSDRGLPELVRLPRSPSPPTEAAAGRGAGAGSGLRPAWKGFCLPGAGTGFPAPWPSQLGCEQRVCVERLHFRSLCE